MASYLIFQKNIAINYWKSTLFRSIGTFFKPNEEPVSPKEYKTISYKQNCSISHRKIVQIQELHIRMNKTMHTPR